MSWHAWESLQSSSVNIQFAKAKIIFYSQNSAGKTQLFQNMIIVGFIQRFLVKIDRFKYTDQHLVRFGLVSEVYFSVGQCKADKWSILTKHLWINPFRNSETKVPNKFYKIGQFSMNALQHHIHTVSQFKIPLLKMTYCH